MLQKRCILEDIGRKRESSLGRPPPLGKRRTVAVANAGRWSFGNIFEAVKGITSQKLPQQPASENGLQHLAEAERVRLALPPTFQRLSPDLMVLLDPKHDRLIYLLSVDEALSTVAVEGQLRGLLRAAAAPYVHLMGLPAGLRKGLLRQFPGGQPIISGVPLPAELAMALQQQGQGQEGQQQQGQQMQRQGTTASARLDGASPVSHGDTGSAFGRQKTGPWARGGVLEFLYGGSELPPGASVSDGPGVSGGEAPTDAGDADGFGSCGSDRDMPDDVLSRRRKVESLMEWRKGASLRVLRQRAERTPYKFSWLVEGFNSLDDLSVVAASPNLILIRNNVDANLEMDGVMDSEDEEEEEDDGGGAARRGDGRPAAELVLQVDGDGRLPGFTPDDITAFFKALGGVDSDSDGDDEEEGEGDGDEGAAAEADGDDDEEEADGLAVFVNEDGELVLLRDDDEEEEGEAIAVMRAAKDENSIRNNDGDEDGVGLTTAAFMSLVGRQGSFRQLVPGVFVRVADDDDDDDSDEEKADDDGKGGDVMASRAAKDGDSDDEGDGDENAGGLTPAALMSLLGRQGAFQQLVPGVFVRVANDGSGNDSDSDDTHGDDEGEVWEDTLDVQLSPGPMGWTASLRLGREGGDGGSGRGGGGATSRALRDALLKSLQADAEYLHNMSRLETMWNRQQQAQGSGLLSGPEQGAPQQQGSGPDVENGSRPRLPEAGQAQAAGGGVDANSDGGSSSSSSSNGSGDLEADWRQAEGRVTASASSSGRPRLPLSLTGGAGAAAARGAVPADRLLRPPRRPGSSAAAAAQQQQEHGNGADEGPAGRHAAAAAEDGSNGVVRESDDASSSATAPQPGRLRRTRAASPPAQAAAPLLPPFGAAAAAAAGSGAEVAEGVVASTRVRRATGGSGEGAPGDGAAGAAAQGGDSNTGADTAASDEAEDDSDAKTDVTGASVRPAGRSRMVGRLHGRMRPFRPPPGSGAASGAGQDQDQDGPTDASAAVGPTPTSATPSLGPDRMPHELAATSASISANAAPGAGSSGGSDNVNDDVIPIPVYRNLRQGASAADAGAGSSSGVDSSSGGPGRAPCSRSTGPAAGPAGATGSGSLPPEAAGYANLDLDQLAQFVLGRQASPEEVQDLARAVAQSAEVEDAFGSIAGRPSPQQPPSSTPPQPPPQPQSQQRERGTLGAESPGGGHRPALQPPARGGVRSALPPQIRELLGESPSRRPRPRVVTRRRRRLHVPRRVLELAAKQWPQGRTQGPPPSRLAELGAGQRPGDAVESAGAAAGSGNAGSAAGGPKLLSRLALRRLGGRRADREGEAAELSPAGPPEQSPELRALQQQPQSVSEPQLHDPGQNDEIRQEELAEAMVGALRTAPPLQRRAAEALIAFLRGRPTQRQQTGGQQLLAAAVGGRGEGLPGLVRGRDAVVVLPRALLQAAVGAWHQQELRLMHADYRVGREAVKSG